MQDHIHQPTTRNANGHLIVMAGATGELGYQIARFLRQHGAQVRALVRQQSAEEAIVRLQELEADIREVDFEQQETLQQACMGASCVVSALSGLQHVMIDLQTNLLTAAVAAGVPRFIPSDFSADFTAFPYGINRNFDFRKVFKERLDCAPIQATSIFNGMFMDLLLGPAPLILFPLRKILFWGNAHQLMDFTTIDNVARFTALAALDPHTPRQLNIAGDVLSAAGLKTATETALGKKFGLLRMGGLSALSLLIRITRLFVPGTHQVFPPWQGMQYLHDMLGGTVKLQPLHNERYAGIQWTNVQQYLTANR